MNIIKKIYNFYVLKNFEDFRISPIETKKIIEKLNSNNKNDLISRSYKQFFCYKKIQGKSKMFVINFVSFWLLPVLFLFLILKKIFFKKNINETNNAVSLIITKGIIQNSIIKKYNIIENSESNYFLNLNDFFFILKIILRYPFSYFFILKIALKIAHYRFLKDTYNCKAIIQSYEYSFTSSALTLFCNNNNIKHINVMHGEKLYYIRDSFFEFHEYYIWDEFYKNLFQKLGASTNQFIIELPPVFDNLNEIKNKKGEKFKYYLNGSESIEQILLLKTKLENKFGKIIFRPHPLFSDISKIMNHNIELEDVKQINIVESINECKTVCAKYSTVLFQALIANRNIIVDNITNSVEYEDIKNRDFIILSKPHKKLSEII